ncbi:hypothetical protein [Chenggangzhangella methanolivorans]|uniref:Uncharacterized protein n=1 Tax=Chenggangzhangella methanolivorans TaxID=1437009 RepID=A0A9E6RAE5_9HYPH|nr:hypothetical protein [Chenggangzhangella methanolivorans]QZO01148.1 hypothetical protein K6K41_06240 [Chenggangzhangella methanolivorans]
MLDGIEHAGFAPVGFRTVHGFAYLGNLLAPLWDVDPLDGKILKKGYPYYPEVRQALDTLIFNGLVDLTKLEAKCINSEWVAEGEIGLNYKAARPLLDKLDVFSDEKAVRDFLKALAFSVSPFADELPHIVMSDVTWTDNRTGRGDVIDFAEYRNANYSLNVANAFDRALPTSMIPSRGEKLQFYIHLLEKRASVLRS